MEHLVSGAGPRLRVALLEPYATGSHAAWLQGYAAHSAHDVQPLTLDGFFWKWRMHGGAVTLARLWRERQMGADLILATDMLDLSTFLALTRERTHATPAALYMHENQLTYPTRPGEKRDLHYGFINYASMLCAERIWFNSQYHLESWFDELPRLLKHFPDHTELQTVAELRAQAEVLPLGLDLAALDAARPAAPRQGPALIVWNHRWEYDKDPATFLRALYALADEGLPFEVAILGEMFVRVPPEFAEARERLGARIAQFGYAPTRAEYAGWLWQADIAVSTALHDFFGAAVVEALYCDCYPLLPDRLAYPSFVPADRRGECLYHGEDELVARLAEAVRRVNAARAQGEPSPLPSLRAAAAKYDWQQMAPIYDGRLAEVVAGRAHKEEA